MCGQFGFLTNKRSSHADDFIRDAFTASMLRGFDSSGIASIDMRDAMAIVHKLPVMGTYFKDDGFAKSLILDAGAQEVLTMCHVRAATVGRVSISNAHPFEAHENGRVVVGTHNGTLTNWTTKKDARPFTVDSEWAINHIMKEGYDAFEDFTGAYSFVWWDSDHPKVVNMARNSQRPMAVCFLKDGSMAYASEPGMLYWLLERNHMKPEPGSILELDMGKWYKFEMMNPKQFTTVDLPIPATYSGSYSFGSSTYNNSTHNYSLTTMEKVDRLLAKVAGTAVQTVTDRLANAPKLSDEPVVYDSEVAKARDYGWLGTDIEFTPTDFRDDDNATIGMVEAMGAIFEGRIRGDLSTFPWQHTWHCKVIGVQDDGEELVMVLSKPFKTTEPVPLM